MHRGRHLRIERQASPPLIVPLSSSTAPSSSPTRGRRSSTVWSLCRHRSHPSRRDVREGGDQRLFAGIGVRRGRLPINEELDRLLGVEIIKVPERIYINGPTAAHAIGHLGLPDASDLEERPELDPSVRVGKLGIEKFYDELLQGIPGTEGYRVRRGQIIDTRPSVSPTRGSSVVLSIDLGLQEVVEMALEEGIQLSNEVKDIDRAEDREVFSVTERGAAVVLDADTFEVLAAASFPDFDPQFFVAGIDADRFQELNESRAFNNLATNGLYPPASTFKAITYTVTREENLPLPENIEGIDADNRQVHCDGTLELPARRRHTAGEEGLLPAQLRVAGSQLGARGLLQHLLLECGSRHLSGLPGRPPEGDRPPGLGQDARLRLGDGHRPHQ